MSKHYDEQYRLTDQCTRTIRELVDLTCAYGWSGEEYRAERTKRLARNRFARLTQANQSYVLGFERALHPLYRMHELFEFKFCVDGVWQTTKGWNGEMHIRVATAKPDFPTAFFWKGTDKQW